MLIYTILGLVYFKRGKASFEAHPFKIYRDKKIIKEIMSMGMASLIMSVMSLVQAVVVFNALSGFGTTSDIAFYGAAYRIFTLMLTPLFGADARVCSRLPVLTMAPGRSTVSLKALRYSY